MFKETKAEEVMRGYRGGQEGQVVIIQASKDLTGDFKQSLGGEVVNHVWLKSS